MQVVESAELSLTDFALRAGFSLAGAGFSRPRRDITSALKTVFWTYSLCRLTKTPRPYGLQQRLEPESLWRDSEGNRRRRNRWPEFAKGLNEPRGFLKQIEEACPGSGSCLECPLWEGLAEGPLPMPQIEGLARRLSTPVKALLERNGLWPGKQGKPVPKLFDGKFAAALERRACLDALAAIILLVRAAHASDRPEIAYKWGRQLWRMWVLLTPMLVKGGIARALAELIQERIMPMACYAGACYGFPDGTVVEVAREFPKAWRSLFALERTGTLRGAARRARIGPDLLAGQHGWDYHFAFHPIPLLDGGEAPWQQSRQADPDVDHAVQCLWLHSWGKNMLKQGRHPAYPARAVWDGADLHSRSSTPLIMWGVKTNKRWRVTRL